MQLIQLRVVMAGDLPGRHGETLGCCSCTTLVGLVAALLQCERAGLGLMLCNMCDSGMAWGVIKQCTKWSSAAAAGQGGFRVYGLEGQQYRV